MPRYVIRSAVLVILVAGALYSCTSETTTEPTLSKDDGRAMGGKADEVDVCELFEWYGDGECDEFCPVYDEADCEAACSSDADCPAIACVRAPCPTSACIDGMCAVDVPDDVCAAGEHECETCDRTIECVPQSEGCVLYRCPPPAPAASCGSRGLAPCPEGEFCNWETSAMCGSFDVAGTCEAIPEACTRELRPVCGCDLATYDNTCAANAAGVSVYAEGACE